jgi:hypothetical protein
MKPGAIALLCALLAGCGTPLASSQVPTAPPGASPSSASSPSPGNLNISNATTLIVTLVVNGLRVGEVPPDSQRTIEAFGLPALPWNVEARSPTGRVLMTYQVQPGDVQTYGSSVSWIDLSCGRLWIGQGNLTPDAPVPLSPGKTGDCTP